MNTDAADQQVQDIIYARYNNKWNAYNKGYLTAEGCNFGRNFHNFGMVPGYFLSAYILGVRMTGPVWDKRILIEPRLGKLADAEGVVVTAYGPVKVSWKRAENNLDFSFTVPDIAVARVGIPISTHQPTVILNGKKVVDQGKILEKGIEIAERFVYLTDAVAGSYSGECY